MEFPVNQLLFQQRRSDVEIYRCRADLSAAPRYGAYLKLVNELRSRYKDILFNGQMVVTDGMVSGDETVICSAFTKDDELAVVLTQSSKESAAVDISVCGYEVIDFASARSDAEFDGKTVTLPCDSLAVLLCKKCR